MNNDQIIICETIDWQLGIEVKLTGNSLWLNQYQLADLFNTDLTAIVKHIRNIFKTGELSEEATCAKFAQVQKEGVREIKRDISHYNLNLIISVGYRVNSNCGTQFRIWANKVLKAYLVEGFAINEQKLKDQADKFIDLKQTVTLLRNKVQNSEEATGLLNVITDYSYA